GIVDETSLVSGLDVLPTLCDYAGVPAPENVRGRSLRAEVDGGGWERSFVVSELADYGEKTREGRMLRTRRYKYVVFNGGARPEQLFDLELDAGEVLNLVSKLESAPESAQVLGEHRELLGRWLEETGDHFKPA
ncbi:MAG: sulfatase/phosphatase domain-containing protein, partial [Bryobacteraceae bacterium]